MTTLLKAESIFALEVHDTQNVLKKNPEQLTTKRVHVLLVKITMFYPQQAIAHSSQ